VAYLHVVVFLDLIVKMSAKIENIVNVLEILKFMDFQVNFPSESVSF